MNNFEIEILNKIKQGISPFLEKFFEVITHLGGQEILILIILIIYFCISKRIGQRIAFTIFGSLLVNNSLKVLINRTRPFNHEHATFEVHEDVKSHATGQSFPSGHSQNSAVTYTSIALASENKYLWLISIVIIVLVALSRVVLGVHYPSDILVGVFLGIVLAYLGANLHQRYEDDFKKQIKLYWICALIFLPVLLIYLGKVKSNYLAYKDLFTIYSFYIGYILAVCLEKRFVDFNEDRALKLKIIRTLISIIIMLALLLGLKAIFPKDNLIFDMLRYFMLSFVCLGVYPVLFKKILF